MVERLCSRVVILSEGRIVCEQRLADLNGPGRPSLEEVFVTATRQRDYMPVARDIMQTIEA
jgi:hypothetical protein